MPDIKGMIYAGKFISYGELSCKNLDDLFIYIKQKPVFFKPVEGDGGEGIFLCKYDGTHFFWNQKLVEESELKEIINLLKYYFISDLVYQHKYIENIYPHSVNTIRILTLKDPINNEVFIASAAHRIGNEQSKPVDNCAKGGFTANIDIRSGLLGKAVATYFSGEEPIWYKAHPDTNITIEGVEIPNWDMIKTKILKLATDFSFMEYIGWDIVLQPDGSIIILEANDGADLKLHQVHKPLLSNPRIKNFYSFHNC